MNRKALILGINGTKLSTEEKELLKHEKPWGIILFSRNVKNIKQLEILIKDIRKNIHDPNYPILIDQEGGNVSRLNKIIDFSLFSQGNFGKLFARDKKIFNDYYSIYINNVCDILKKVGININTVPVLDIRRKKSHNVIGNRSFASETSTVTQMGNICINLYKKNKIATVVKHIPGHGLAKSDSHFNLPIIKAKKNELVSKDFIPFKKCHSLFAMTAHVIYSQYDPHNAATHSKIVINNIIRKHIGFKGILISDDISMKALKYGLEANTTKALEAGCNLVLHCNGNIKEMKKLLKIAPKIDKLTQKKTSQFYNFLR